MKIPFFKLGGFFVVIISVFFSFFVKNLFLKFLGSSFFFIFLFLLFYYIITIIRFSKNKIELISFGDGILYPFKESIIEIEGRNYPFEFPGIFFSLKVDVFENNSFLYKVASNVIFFGKNKIKINIYFDRHGEFVFKNFRFVINDIFGLTKYEIKCDFEHNLRVFPYFMNEVEIPFIMEQGGEQVIQNVARINSTDFFENRKYYPGDDTRRINWKIFAHSDELHIREVEKIPPKVGEISLLFAPFSENLLEYEHISSLFLTTVFFLLSNNFEIKIITPISNDYITIKEENEKEFYSILNNSYKLFRNNSLNEIKNLVIFASFQEYKYLTEKYSPGRCSFKVTSYQSNETKKTLYDSISKIDSFDNLFKEIIVKLKEIKNQGSNDNLLKKYKQSALENQIDLTIFRTKDELFKNI